MKDCLKTTPFRKRKRTLFQSWKELEAWGEWVRRKKKVPVAVEAGVSIDNLCATLPFRQEEEEEREKEKKLWKIVYVLRVGSRCTVELLYYRNSTLLYDCQIYICLANLPQVQLKESTFHLLTTALLRRLHCTWKWGRLLMLLPTPSHQLVPPLRWSVALSGVELPNWPDASEVSEREKECVCEYCTTTRYSGLRNCKNLY